MENKTFADFLAETIEESKTEETTEIVEDVVEETAEIEEEPEEIELDESTESTEEVEESEPVVEDKPEFKAFAEMRVKNKQLAEEKEKIESELLKAEALAKKLKFSNIDEMLAEASKRELMEEAKQSNVPVEYLERMKKLEEKDAQREKEVAQFHKEQKETALMNTLDSFVESNKLSQKDFETTLNAMDADGFQYETLLELPLTAVSKILNSYTNKEVSKQKELANKAKLSKEIPMTPTETNDGVIPDKVDDIFMIMSGQKRDF